MTPFQTTGMSEPLLTENAPNIDLESRPHNCDEWECRGFEKPLPKGVQHAHGESFHFLREGDHVLHRPRPEMDWKRKRAVLAICACVAVMLVEGTGGMLAGSLALVVDAAHMLADVAGYCVLLIALKASSKQPSKSASFGLHRAEVLGGLGSILIIWAMVGVLLYEAGLRLFAMMVHAELPATDGRIMLAVALVGLVSNVSLLCLFSDGGAHGHGHSHSHSDSDDMSTRAALVHVVGDVMQSVGVLLSAVLIAFDGDRWVVLDPLVTIGCSIYMLYGTISLLQEAIGVLMEAPPSDVDASLMRDVLSHRPDVRAIRCFHVWAIAPGKVTLTAHVLCPASCEDTDDVLMDLQKIASIASVSTTAPSKSPATRVSCDRLLSSEVHISEQAAAAVHAIANLMLDAHRRSHLL
eukprot:CAMPEP_0183332988 /NCGR_PEP_ID=MMETSP0164_2-20130417/2015_1 /TAXON_ID=221442 /ORGANISM="Coccolithus pelagicus ssp braarudi, Strain PLY182g" /LENGTH=408 /DNA_ID=CAMNT_0025501811 /DNA_START=54 /DNA_END=1281 /DNA_ORIENTATION=+